VLKLELPLVAATKMKRDRDKPPQFPRPRLKKLTERLMRARSLRHAATILRNVAAKSTGAWAWYMNKLALGLYRIHDRPNEFESPHPVFILEGNDKLPFATFSTLPQYTCPGAGECLKWCYSFTAWRNAGPWSRQVMNTLLLRFGKRVIAHWFRELDRDIVLRLYVDGDFDSPETIDFWFTLLRERPDIKAYGYSKSWDLLWQYAQDHPLPDNYTLNLSGGGAPQAVNTEQMMNLSITRGQFLSIHTNYRPANHKGRIGFARYDDPAYHKAVRDAAMAQGLGRVFSCPGKCGECAAGRHACGSSRFQGITIVNGVH
jgi:hypothetical protein